MPENKTEVARLNDLTGGGHDLVQDDPARRPLLAEAAPAKAVTQLELLTHGRIELEHWSTVLTALPPDDQLSSPPPSKQLVESVRTHGMLDPIALADRHDGTYHVIDGRRRIKALRQVHGTEAAVRVRALLYRGEGYTPIALGAFFHASRSANPMSDLEIIMTLGRALIAERKLAWPEIEQEIAKATGLSVGTVRARRKLLALEAPFRAAMKTGAVTMALAEKLAALPAERRAKLLPVLAKNGKLTAADLDAERRVASAAVSEMFDWDDPAEAATPAPEDDVLGWVARAFLAGPGVTGVERVDAATLRLARPGGGSYLVRVSAEE